MDINEALDLIQENGRKCLILKDDQAFVLLSFEEYQKIAASLKIKEKSTKSGIGKPNTDIRTYEIPKLPAEQDKYFPEPLPKNLENY